MKTVRLDNFRSKNIVKWMLMSLLLLPVVGLLFFYFGYGIAFFVVPLAVAIVAAYRLHLRRLAEMTGEISEASRIHLATVEALATAIDARDQAGVGHVRRVQIYAVGVGRLLELPESDIDALRTGALLHDIGKLAIPDHILNKTEPLTPAELEKTKIHPHIGASILESVGFTYPVVPTVKFHHERWDGGGYPQRLKAGEIPLTARILSVVDAFDSIRIARPYRAAQTREKARQVLQAEAGTRFDPSIVDLFLRNLRSLEADIAAEGLLYADSQETVERSAGGQNYVEQIKLANREVFSLYELAREFSGSVGLADTLQMFAQKVREFVPFDTCAVYMLDATKRSATATHIEGDNGDLLMMRRVKVGQGATGFALKSHETVQNVDPDLDFSYSQVELTQTYTTMASVPLLADEELIGAITLYAYDLEKYGEEHIRLLETIAHIASDAISKSLKHDEATTHAMTDPMTGLPNARSLQMQFEKEVARAGRGGTSFQLLMLDLDGFKAVNDTYGHKVGDEMLKEISQVIMGQLREYDFLARYGGDEFIALIPETTAEDVIDLCTRIESAVCGFSLEVDGSKSARVGVSLGASGYPEHGETFDQMVIAADKIMYERKATRKRFTLTHNTASPQRPAEPGGEILANVFIDMVPDAPLIVELDETHVVSSMAVN